MPEYYAYVIGEDGHIKQRIDLVCADDDTTKERAKALVDGEAIELWQSSHLIATSRAAPASEPRMRTAFVRLQLTSCRGNTITKLISRSNIFEAKIEMRRANSSSIFAAVSSSLA